MSSPNSNKIETRLLSRLAQSADSSVIRDLLAQARRPEIISLAGGIPSSYHFPVDEISAVASRVLNNRGRDVLQYGLTPGETAFREVLSFLTSPTCHPEDLVVTTGSQQGLDLIARVLIDPGDSVVVSDPDYLGALQTFKSYQAKLVPMPMDADGLDTNTLEEELNLGLRPKFVHIVPNFHNPTGASLSVERRQHLANLSSNYGFVVVEDDPYKDLWFESEPPASIPADPELLVQLRSISKVIAPGIRIGWIHGPRWLIDAVGVVKQAVDLHTSTFDQAIASELLDQTEWLEDHLGKLRDHYRSQSVVLTEAVAATFGGAVDFVAPAGGMFLWLRFLDEAIDTSALLSRAIEAGVAFIPGRAFAVSSPMSTALRLSYSTVSRDQIPVAISRLASAVHQGR